MMRFAVLCVAAASLLRGREQLEAQVARSAVKLLQEAALGRTRDRTRRESGLGGLRVLGGSRAKLEKVTS